LGGDKSDEHRDSEPDHRVLRLDADAEHESEQQPLPPIGATQQPNEEQAYDRPDELVEGDRLKEDVGSDEQRRDHHGERRECLRHAISPQLSRDQRRDHDHSGAGEDGEQAQAGHGAGKDGPVEPRQQRRDRRVVDVTECEIPARGQVIKLVPVPAVAVGDGHGHAHLGGDEQEQDRPGRACFDWANLAQR
jgi:hypothetical protein